MITPVVNYAQNLWQEGVPIPGTLVETYLKFRVPALDPALLWSNALRFHHSCPFRHLISKELFRCPAMLALQCDAITNEPRAVHRTAIREDGKGKATMPDGGDPKRMLGSSKGCVIKLSPDEDVTLGLAIAEGIETAASVFTTGIFPVWAAGSCAIIQNFLVLRGIETLTIYADNDENQAGQRAALACAKRWQEAGRECVIWQPKQVGADWNDITRGVHHA